MIEPEFTEEVTYTGGADPVPCNVTQRGASVSVDGATLRFTAGLSLMLPADLPDDWPAPGQSGKWIYWRGNQMSVQSVVLPVTVHGAILYHRQEVRAVAG